MKIKRLVLAALFALSPLVANAVPISTYGDIDCFGTDGACVEDGSTWLPGAWGGVPITEADDPIWTDRLYTRGEAPMWEHTFAAGSYSDATLSIRTAGIADILGPYDVYADGILVGSMPLDGFGHILVETFVFALDASLLSDGLVSVMFETGAGDFWAIDYAQIDATVASVPEPGTLALFGIGLLGLGLMRRKVV